MFLRMLSRFREDLLFGFTSHYVLTPARGIDLGAFQDLGHELASCVIDVEMIHDDARAVRHTLCLMSLGDNTFFSGATTTILQLNGGIEVTGGERIMSPRMSSFSEVTEEER